MRVAGLDESQVAVTRTVLLKNASRYDEGSRGLTIVVVAGGLLGIQLIAQMS